MSARATVLGLARIEGRRLARHPFVLAAAILPVAAFLQYLFDDGQTDADYVWALFVPFLPLGAAVMVAVNLAALRSRRDGAEELYRSLPAPASARTAGHLVSLAWAIVAGALLVAILVPIFLSKGNALPSVAQTATTPALIALCGALGLALGRWLPHPGAATVGVVAVFALSNAVFSWGQLSHGAVVVGFLALAALFGALALLRDRPKLA